MLGSASAPPSGLRSSRTEHPQPQQPKGWAKPSCQSQIPMNFNELSIRNMLAAIEVPLYGTVAPIIGMTAEIEATIQERQ